MKTNMFEGDDLTPEEVIDNLEASCIKVEEGYDFLKPFTETQLQELEKNVIDLLKKLQLNEDKKKLLIDPIQAKIKELKKSISSSQRMLVQQGMMVKEKVYFFADYENQNWAIYDSRGIFVGARPMNREERQLHINSGRQIHLKDQA